MQQAVDVVEDVVLGDRHPIAGLVERVDRVGDVVDLPVAVLVGVAGAEVETAVGGVGFLVGPAGEELTAGRAPRVQVWHPRRS